MISPRVFVVQNQQRWDDFQQRFVPKFDLNPAREFGRLIYLLSPSASPFNPDSYLPELQARLRDFNDSDALLCIGSPVLMVAAATVAAGRNQGRVRVLQWSGTDRAYRPVMLSGLFTSPDR